MYKKVEDRLVQNEDLDHADKKHKIELLNETVFKVKFKLKVENCVLQISVDHKFGSNICNI